MYEVDVVPRSKFLNIVTDEIKVFEHQVLQWHFFFLAEVDELALDAVARCAELILHDQCAPVYPIALVGCMKLVQHRHGGLNEGSDGERFVELHGDIADANFQSIEERMRPDIPPNLLAIVDAMRLDQQVYKGLVLGPVGEDVRNRRSGEALENF